MSELFGSNGGGVPAGWMMSNAGGSGSPKVWSNTWRSLRIVGDPKESTRTMVRPRPSKPRSYSGFRSYAFRSWNGW